MNYIKLKWLFLGSFINNIAVSTIWPLTTIYMHNALKKSLTEVGIILFLFSVSNVLGNYVSGKLFDKHNRYPLTIFGIVFSILVSGMLIFFHGWPAYPIGLVLLGFGTGWNLTMVNSLGTTITNQSSRHIFNMLYLAQNIGVVLGTMFVGFVYPYGIGYVFTITTLILIIYGVSAAITYKQPDSIYPIARENTEHKNVRLPKPNLVLVMTLFFSLSIIWIVYEQWVSNLSVYITGMGIPLSMYSFLWTINAFLLVVFQLIISWLSRFYDNLYLQIYLGIFFIGLSYFILVFTHSYLGFVLSMTVLTIGEASVIPSIPAVVNYLTPVEVKGKYQGLNNAWASIGKAFGPLLGGMIIEAYSYNVLFIASLLVCIVLIACIVFSHVIYGKKFTNFDK
ncbi:MDR family MFS transporter [Apilactobacillus xinyiensis]|uniref:MDR family MFS transporter n=1 Tax=Apilactobacillus xinyiensis TaxID=2841032 RepID=UPI001C7DB709|nr:MFS transporter [Apilactobacillus xinyiensis]